MAWRGVACNADRRAPRCVCVYVCVCVWFSFFFVLVHVFAHVLVPVLVPVLLLQHVVACHKLVAWRRVVFVQGSRVDNLPCSSFLAPVCVRVCVGNVWLCVCLRVFACVHARVCVCTRASKPLASSSRVVVAAPAGPRSNARTPPPP